MANPSKIQCQLKVYTTQMKHHIPFQDVTSLLSLRGLGLSLLAWANWSLALDSSSTVTGTDSWKWFAVSSTEPLTIKTFWPDSSP